MQACACALVWLATSTLAAAATTENCVGWGYNNYGQAITLGACSKISSGGQHTVALQSDGAVVAWGAGRTNTGTWPELGQAMIASTLGTCTQISAGYAHTMALQTGGIVVAWGAGTTTQTSGGTSGLEFGQSIVPSTLGTCTQIAAGGAHSMALKSNATVVAWGNNGNGQCTVPATLGTCTKIAAGLYHSAAIQNNSLVVAWGNNAMVNAPCPPH